VQNEIFVEVSCAEIRFANVQVVVCLFLWVIFTRPSPPPPSRRLRQFCCEEEIFLELLLGAVP
jgi:hypothetical protein